MPPVPALHPPLVQPVEMPCSLPQRQAKRLLQRPCSTISALPHPLELPQPAHPSLRYSVRPRRQPPRLLKQRPNPLPLFLEEPRSQAAPVCSVVVRPQPRPLSLRRAAQDPVSLVVEPLRPQNRRRNQVCSLPLLATRRPSRHPTCSVTLRPPRNPPTRLLAPAPRLSLVPSPPRRPRQPAALQRRRLPQACLEATRRVAARRQPRSHPLCSQLPLPPRPQPHLQRPLLLPRLRHFSENLRQQPVLPHPRHLAMPHRVFLGQVLLPQLPLQQLHPPLRLVLQPALRQQQLLAQVLLLQLLPIHRSWAAQQWARLLSCHD